MGTPTQLIFVIVTVLLGTTFVIAVGLNVILGFFSKSSFIQRSSHRLHGWVSKWKWRICYGCGLGFVLYATS